MHRCARLRSRTRDAAMVGRRQYFIPAIEYSGRLVALALRATHFQSVDDYFARWQVRWIASAAIRSEKEARRSGADGRC